MSGYKDLRTLRADSQSLALCLLFPSVSLRGLQKKAAVEISLLAMACVVECYNPALAPSSAANLIAIPESLRTKFGIAAPETVLVSPRALHSLSHDLCSSEHSLHSSSGSTVEAAEYDGASPRNTAAAGVSTRAEPSSPPPRNAEQLGRPSAVLAERIHDSMRQREAALPPVQLASPQLHKRCVFSAAAAL